MFLYNNKFINPCHIRTLIQKNKVKYYLKIFIREFRRIEKKSSSDSNVLLRSEFDYYHCQSFRQNDSDRKWFKHICMLWILQLQLVLPSSALVLVLDDPLRNVRSSFEIDLLLQQKRQTFHGNFLRLGPWWRRRRTSLVLIISSSRPGHSIHWVGT